MEGFIIFVRRRKDKLLRGGEREKERARETEKRVWGEEVNWNCEPGGSDCNILGLHSFPGKPASNLAVE